MDFTKAWWASRTMIAGLVILLGGILNIFGIVLTPDDQAALTELLNTALLTFGGLAVLFFRKKAEKKIA